MGEVTLYDLSHPFGDKVTGTRCTFAGFPIRWMKGDGSIVRLVAIVDKGDQ